MTIEINIAGQNKAWPWKSPAKTNDYTPRATTVRPDPAI
jgi:hypothetical protein